MTIESINPTTDRTRGPMPPEVFAQTIVSIEKNYGLRLDARSVWLRMDNSCGKGWEGVQGHCQRSKKVWSSESISTGGFGGLEPGVKHDPVLLQSKIAKITKLADALESGRFKDNPKDDERTQYGKSGALTALRDGKNPRIGLIAAKNKDGQPVGFMSYKPGRTSIEIQNLGTDQSQKGTGRALFNNLLAVAAKTGKGLSVAPTDDAIGFYQRMGMTKDSEGSLSMTSKQVQELARKNQRTAQQGILG